MRKISLNEGDDLRPDRLAAIEKENAAAQFVELLHLHPLPRLRPGLALRARGEPAHGQRGDLKSGTEQPSILRVRNLKAEYGRDKEVVEAIDREQRCDAGFPKAPDNRDDHHRQKVERPGSGEVQAQAEGDQRYQGNGRQSGQVSAEDAPLKRGSPPIPR